MPIRKTWFLVLDGAKARLFQNMGFEEPLEAVAEWHAEEAREFASEIGERPPTHGHVSGTSRRFAIDEVSRHEKAEEEFLKGRTRFLNDAAAGKEFDQLVLAAPPKALGICRRFLSPAATGFCIAVLDKDLTNLDDQELHEYFKKHVGYW